MSLITPLSQALAVMGLTGKPSSPNPMAGASTSRIVMVPKCSTVSIQPAAAPGTVTVWTPYLGSSVIPLSARYSMLRPAGALPLALSALTSFVSASKKRQKQSPPMPVLVGSVTLRAAAVATAASAALPPSWRTPTPAMEARGWLLATMPWVPYTGERRELNLISVVVRVGGT